MNQFNESSTLGLCANPYCSNGKDGGRKEIPIRDKRGTDNYCGRACASMKRYTKRYRGTNAGPLSRETVIDKMTKL